MNRLVLLAAALVPVFAPQSAFALEWDTIQLNSTADGGSGIWDLATPNWFNGSTNVPWDSTSAVFGGANDLTATISVPSGGVQATSILFESRMIIAADTTDGDALDDTLIPIGMIPVSAWGLGRITAPIAGSGGLNITSGAVSLSGNNSYTGGTHINGSVNALSTTALGSGPVTLLSENLSYSSAPSGTISNDFIFDAGGSQAPYVQFGSHTLTGSINVQRSVLLGVVTGFGEDPLTLSGPISGSSSATLTLGFNGNAEQTVRLTQSSPFAGTVSVASGNLSADAGAGLPNAEITLSGPHNFPGQLSGNGSFGTVAINGSGRISPGDNGLGTLTIGTLVSGGGLAIEFELGNTSDHLVVNGAVNFAASLSLELLLLPGFAPDEGDLFFLLQNDLADPIIGEFFNYPEGQDIHLGGHILRPTYTADSATNSFEGGNDFALKVVPEPASALLLLTCAPVILACRRRP